MAKSVLWRVNAGEQPVQKFSSRSAAYEYARTRQSAGDRVSIYHFERNDWVLYERLALRREQQR